MFDSNNPPRPKCKTCACWHQHRAADFSMGDCLLFPITVAKHEDQFCFQHYPDAPKGVLRRGPGGAVVTNDRIEGHPMFLLVAADAAFYGGNYLVCESMPETFGPVLAAALGMRWEG